MDEEKDIVPPGASLAATPKSAAPEGVFIEMIGRYIDGTLQDDVHPEDVEFERVVGSGRDVAGGWACDFTVLLHGRRARITISATAA